MNLARRRFVLGSGIAGAALGLLGIRALAAQQPAFAVSHSEAEWRKRLTPAQYAVLREEDTERPFSSPLDHEQRSGIFACAGCGQDLYSSRTKFDSGTGWPSFWKALDNAVVGRPDHSEGMSRDEVLCSRCGGHLGHVFPDGPPPTGLRYCMNGVAMVFKPGAA